MNLKPHCFDAKKIVEEGNLWFDEQNNAHLKINSEEKIIPQNHQYSLLEATLFGLNERLTQSSTSPRIDEKGTTLRDLFNDEWEKYNDAVMSVDDIHVPYGEYVYYEEKNDLVQYAPRFWHKIVSVASSSKLIADSEKKLSWMQIRDVFEKTTIGVAGCSVGSNVAHMSVMDMRPNHIKLADKSLYKMENINRVRLQYNEIVKNNADRGDSFGLPLQNKAETTARQIYGIDPFINVHVYAEGVHEGNVNQFFDGGEGEPALDIVVDEVDDPRVKIFLRLEAKKRKIPLLMVTDIGSCVQLDVIRFDLDPESSFAFDAKNENLTQTMEAVYTDAGNKKVFFDFVDTLIGKDYRTDELCDIIEGKCEIPTSTIIPQLGSTAAMAGAVAAETIARIRLGQNFSPRMIFNKKTFEVKIYR